MPRTTRLPRPRRRWLRLSVRGLIALVLVAGVGLGWMTYSLRGRRAALLGIEAAGGKSYHGGNARATPADRWSARAGRAVRDWAESWLGPGMVDDVEAVAFEGPATADDLAQLVWFTHLKKITLEDTNRVGDGWRHLRGHPELTELVLRYYPEMTTPVTDGPGVDDAALREVGQIDSLTSLEVYDPTATAEGYAALAGLTELEDFALYGGDGPDDAGAARMLAGLPALRMLSLHPDRPSPRTATLAALAAHHPDLNFLALSKAELTDADFVTIARITHLTSLRLTDGRITDAGVAHLGRMTELETLSLDGPGLTDAGLQSLAGLVNLDHLDLDGASITDAGLPALGGMPLVGLNLSKTGVTDAGMAQIARLATLERLDLSDLPTLTDAGLVPLQRLTRLETLVVNDCPRITRKGIAALRAAVPSLVQVYPTELIDPEPPTPGPTTLETRP